MKDSEGWSTGPEDGSTGSVLEPVGRSGPVARPPHRGFLCPTSETHRRNGVQGLLQTLLSAQFGEGLAVKAYPPSGYEAHDQCQPDGGVG